MFAKFSVKKPYTVLVAVVLVVILGIVSLTKMTADLLPNINLPYVVVMTTYVGASPETVEMTVTKPIEASMATVSNVEGITSTSSENYSMVIMEFAQSANMDSVSLEIRENLDQVKSYWDDSVGNPIIMKINPNMLPIMVAAVGVEGMSAAEISDYTNDYLLPELESIEGVASATASGLLEESVHVIIREDKIAAINKQVFGAIDSEMEDAEKELADGRKELQEGKQEIADGWVEINNNITDIEKSQKELEDSKNSVWWQHNQLAGAQTSLTEQREQAAKEMAEAQTALIDAKAEIASAKATLNTALMPLEEAKAKLSAKNSLTQLKMGIQGIQFKYSIDGSATLDEALATEGLTETEKVVLQSVKSLSGMSGTTTLVETVAILDAQINALSAYTETMVAELETQLAPYATQLKELEAKEAELDAALTELAKNETIASATFGSTEAQIISGRNQLYATEGQLKSAEEQLKSGLEQIDSAKEQLIDAEAQLKDAEKQLADGEKQLEEAREEAYLNADMTGVLTVDTVKSLLTAQNFSMPSGYVTEDGVDYLVRVGDKPEDIETLAAMPLINMQMDGVDIVTLADVADVFMTDNSDEIYANVNGSPGVMISMQKQTGYSTGDVSNKINNKFEEIMEANPELTLIGLMDQGIYIDMVMDSIFSSIVFGFGLALLVLIVFLKDHKPTLVIACSVPISLVATIVCMYFSGVTLNIISLSGLALAIGMLVDNSIVVIENIYRLRSEGASVKEACIEGTKEVAGAIVASTLTTVCVFLPIVFTEGITRQLFVDMGLTLGYSLGASLLVALTVVPSVASKVLTKDTKEKEVKFVDKLSLLYEKSLEKCLNHKALILGLTIVLLVVSIFASLSKGTIFMPEMDSNQISMTLTMPNNTSVAEMSQKSNEIVGRLETLEDVQDIGAMLNDDSTSLLGGTAGTVSIYITTKEDKSKTNVELGKEIEVLLADMQDIDVDIQTASMDMSMLSGSGVSVQVRGREIDTLKQLAKEVALVVEGVEGTADVSNGLEEASGEMRILVNRDKAIEHGLTVAQVFTQIASKLATPTSATTLNSAIKEYDVFVVNEVDESLTRETLQNIQIDATNQDGKKEKVLLSDIATFEQTESLESINRAEQTRYITVSAAIADGYNVGLVSTAVEEALKEYDMPSGYSLHFGGENEMIVEAMEQLMLMMVLAIAFMYLIMVAQFQSLKSPFIILFTIPLAFTGGFLALFLTGSELSVISIIGFIMLAGVIVNNGIVLVDCINQLREGGMSKREAILTAGRTRLRPVLMTAMTTIFSMLTMVFNRGMGADLSKPMALVTIGGLSYGTLLTLLAIPCVYDIFNRENKQKEEVYDV